MSLLANPGAAGALAGLVLGAAEFLIAMAVTRRVLAREMEEEGETPGLEFVARRLGSLRRAFAGFSFLAMPALGYALGSTLGAHGGAR